MARPRLEGAWRRGTAWLALAVVAVALKVLVPPGFMVGVRAESGPSYPLVLCTAQGAVTVDAAGDPDEGPSEGERNHPPCVFAGVGAAAPPPNLVDAAPAEFSAYRGPVLRPLDVPVPGRGLAAPPPPARGPPSLLI